MHDLFDDIDSFVEKALEPPKKKVQKALPTQLAEVTRGTWALNLGDLSGGPSPVCEVGYVFDKQDFIAMAAISGGDAGEMFEATVEPYADNMRYGRWYSPEHPQGEIGERPLYGLIPLSEEEADLCRYVDFKMPVLLMMTDWLQPRLESILQELEETMLAGMKRISCEKCGNNEVKAVVAYTGRMAANVTIIGEEGDKRIQLGTVINDEADQIMHLHLVCPDDTCDWDKCIDLNEYQVFKPGNYSWADEE